jgi:hypothetical protein
VVVTELAFLCLPDPSVEAVAPGFRGTAEGGCRKASDEDDREFRRDFIQRSSTPKAIRSHD